MENQGCDRRILRAFYTQYVAVLLIMLTFTIGIFQRASISKAAVPSPGGEYVAIGKPIGDVVIRSLFGADGSVSSEEPQLKALAHIIRSHDVLLTLTLSMPRLTVEPKSPSLRRALRRINALEQFFMAEEVPREALRFRVTRGDEHENDLVAQVVADESEVSHGLR